MTIFAAAAVARQGVQALLGGRVGSLVDGAIREGEGAPIALQDPATGATLLDYADGGEAIARAAASGAAKGSAPGWPCPPPSADAASGRSARWFGGRRRWRCSNAPIYRQADPRLPQRDGPGRRDSGVLGRLVRQYRGEDLLIRATDLAIRDVGLIPVMHPVNAWATRRTLVYRVHAEARTYAMRLRAR
jgi:hypothetical protein